MWTRFLSDYGMLLVLLALCAVLSIVTWGEQHASGAPGGAALAEDIVTHAPAGTKVLVVVRATKDQAAFAQALESRLREGGQVVLEVVQGEPMDARKALERFARGDNKPDVIAASKEAGEWDVLHDIGDRFPALANVRMMVPRSHSGSYFLRPANLLNIMNQIAIIAIVAIGMTLVILTGGIDLSVGSLIALSAVIATLLIRDNAGAEQASGQAMVACCAAAVAVCGLIGMVNGLIVTRFDAPPFIVTLGMMLVTRGLAFILADGQAISEVPEEFRILGQGTIAGGIPIAATLMLALYVIAHFVMGHTVAGRSIYAVGSNLTAARYSGLAVKRTIVLVYVVSGLLAGLGGIIMASQLKSAAPTYGTMYELNVIVAVVIGGTSLSGGEGKIFGTLIGALLIAVVQNGMNLLNVKSHPQMVVLGSVLIAAVLLDRLKRGNWLWASRRR